MDCSLLHHYIRFYKIYLYVQQMCEMRFEVQGKTDDYIRLEKDFDGVEFLGLLLNKYFFFK